MKNYYFLVAVLPELILGKKAPISYDELRDLLQMNLTKKDLEVVAFFQLFMDITNLQLFWRKMPIDTRGSLSEKEIDEALLARTYYPDYVFDYIDRFEKTADRLLHFSFLVSYFFRETILEIKGFLHSYFLFERELRLIMTALRSKEQKKDVGYQLQYEDPQDPLVLEILSAKDQPSYEPPKEYSVLKQIFSQKDSNPLEIAYKYMQFRFLKIDEMILSQPFSLDRILAYMAQLVIVEDWDRLDQERGKKIVNLIA